MRIFPALTASPNGADVAVYAYCHIANAKKDDVVTLSGTSTLPNDRCQHELSKHSMSPMTSTSKVAISTSRSDRGNARFVRSDISFGPSD